MEDERDRDTVYLQGDVATYFFDSNDICDICCCRLNDHYEEDRYGNVEVFISKEASGDMVGYLCPACYEDGPKMTFGKFARIHKIKVSRIKDANEHFKGDALAPIMCHYHVTIRSNSWKRSISLYFRVSIFGQDLHPTNQDKLVESMLGHIRNVINSSVDLGIITTDDVITMLRYHNRMVNRAKKFFGPYYESFLEIPPDSLTVLIVSQEGEKE